MPCLAAQWVLTNVWAELPVPENWTCSLQARPDFQDPREGQHSTGPPHRCVQGSLPSPEALLLILHSTSPTLGLLGGKLGAIPDSFVRLLNP